MPFFKASGALVYYAHVPKCGGSAVADYIRDRFGSVAFHDDRYLRQPEPQRWTRSSPQHVDVESLERLIPLQFFDACFAFVRHPVARAVSTYHFQQEVEKSIAAEMSFSDWLASLPDEMARHPFASDNHIRPMSQIVPEGATVFHLEHGLDSLVTWLDALTGSADAPRAIITRNTRGDYVRTRSAKVEPSASDLDRIARLYADDFTRFGYDPGERLPKAAPPQMTPEFITARGLEFRRMNTPVARLTRRISRRIRRLGL